MISDGDQNRRLDGDQIFVRKPSPLIADNLAPNDGPVIRIGSHSPVVFSLKLNVPGIRSRPGFSVQHFRFDGKLRRAKGCSIGRDATDKLRRRYNCHDRSSLPGARHVSSRSIFDANQGNFVLMNVSPPAARG